MVLAFFPLSLSSKRGVFYSIWPLDAFGAFRNHNCNRSASVPDFPISHNLRYTPAQPTLFISLHLTSSPPLKLHPHVRTIYVALALRWEVQMILCRETDEVFLGLLNLPSD